MATFDPQGNPVSIPWLKNSYDPWGNWYDANGIDQGKPFWEPSVGKWVIMATNQVVPDPPSNPQQEPAGGTTADPNTPHTWYIQDPNNSTGLLRIDAQGNQIGQYAQTPSSEGGGTGWNVGQTDPNTGGPTQINYKQEQGGLFGLGPVLGSLVGVAMVAGIGAGAAYGIPAAASLLGGTGTAGTAAGAAAAGEAGGGLAGPLGLSGEVGAEAGLGGALPAAGGGGLPSLGELLPYATTATGVVGTGSQVLGGTGSGTTALGSTSEDRAAFNSIVQRAAQESSSSGTDFLTTLGKYAPALATALQAGGGIVGGILGSNAAKSAAQTQAEAANNANALLASIYAQQRADQLPFLQAATGALGQIQQTPDFSAAPYAYTPPAPLDPSQYAFDPSQYQFTLPTGQQALDQDPGYQFRVQQGQKALETSAAARGGLLSGGFAKAAQQYGQNLASQEYQNAVQRSLLTNQTNYERALQGNQLGYGRALQQNQDVYQRGLAANQQDYNRALQSYGLNLGRLQSLAGLGQSAGALLGQAGAQYGTGAAGNITSAGAAQAAGQVGAANALTGGLSQIGGAANNFLNYQLLTQLLQKRT